MEESSDVAIVGGGPVGLLLACLLAQHGVSVRVFEQREEPREHSRAVGIHPPGLSCLAEAGAAEKVLAEAVKVRRAFAFGEGRLLGKVCFSSLPGAYPFVLCVPQTLTERALTDRLAELAPGALVRGHVVTSVRDERDHVELTLQNGARRSFCARYVVGCDGKRSVVREAANIPYVGAAYRERFAMADLQDETPFGDDAAIFLSRAGLVESFPLPDGQRRWVVGLARGEQREVSAELVAELVAERTGQLARAENASMVSAFVPEHYIATSFALGRLVLAGDSAHVVSPIGGQGMSLGWLDAKLLADALAAALLAPADSERLLAAYTKARRRAARSALRRAEVFMTIGQTPRFNTLRDLMVEGLLSAPLVDRAAKVFTMRGLDSSPVVR